MGSVAEEAGSMVFGGETLMHDVGPVYPGGLS